MSSEPTLPLEPLTRLLGAKVKNGNWVGVSTKTVQRWRLNNAVPLSSAERLCDRIGYHPTELWGHAYYAPTPPHPAPPNPEDPHHPPSSPTKEPTMTTELLDQLTATRDAIDAEIDKLAAALDRINEAIDALTPDKDEPADQTRPETPSSPKKKNPVPAGGTFSCDDCDRAFKTKHGLSVHRARTHKKPSRAKPTPAATTGFPCDDCDRAFTTKQNLIKHMAAAGHGILFDCDVCDVPFLTDTDREEHRTRQHPDYVDDATGQLCPWCPPGTDQESRSPEDHNRHIRVFHREQQPTA